MVHPWKGTSPQGLSEEPITVERHARGETLPTGNTNEARDTGPGPTQCELTPQSQHKRPLCLFGGTKAEEPRPWSICSCGAEGGGGPGGRLFSSSSLSALRVVSSAYLRLLIFLPAILIPACASSSPVPRPEQPLGRGSALSRLGAELELRRSGSSLGPSQ